MSSDEQAIRALIAEWHRATVAGEVDRVSPLMAEDVVFLTAGNPPMKGRAAFAEGLRTILKTHRIESSGEIQELQVSGDLAYCWNRLTVKIVPKTGGEPIARTGAALSVFRKQPDGSSVLSRDANLMPPPQQAV